MTDLDDISDETLRSAAALLRRQRYHVVADVLEDAV
jgi:hypothetical protein